MDLGGVLHTHAWDNGYTDLSPACGHWSGPWSGSWPSRLQSKIPWGTLTYTITIDKSLCVNLVTLQTSPAYRHSRKSETGLIGEGKNSWASPVSHNSRGNKLSAQRALVSPLFFLWRKVRAYECKASPAEQDTAKSSHFSFSLSRVLSPEYMTWVGKWLAEQQPGPRTGGFQWMQIWLTASGTSSGDLHTSHLDTSQWSPSTLSASSTRPHSQKLLLGSTYNGGESSIWLMANEHVQKASLNLYETRERTQSWAFSTALGKAKRRLSAPSLVSVGLLEGIWA